MGRLAPYQVRYPVELLSLSVLPLKRKRGIGAVVIVDTAVPKEQRESWERQINRHLRACACRESSIGLLIGLIGFLAYMLWQWSAGAEFYWSHLGWGALVVFACTLIGKGVGLVGMEMRYRKLVQRIAGEWRAQPAKLDAVFRCG